MTDEVEPEWITPKTAARLCELNPVTIRRAIARGDLPAYKVGKSLRIKREDLALMFRAVPNAKVKYAEPVKVRVLDPVRTPPERVRVRIKPPDIDEKGWTDDGEWQDGAK